LRQGSILIFAIHRTETWWRHIAENLGFEHHAVLSEHQGKGDFDLQPQFYSNYRHHFGRAAEESGVLDKGTVADVIARCRLLRWLPQRKAAAMVLAMADTLASILDDVRPTAVVSFPIDRYGKDILARLAEARGIPYYEFTVSPFAGLSMLLRRGRMIPLRDEVDPETIEYHRHELTDPHFTPSYVQGARNFTRLRFLKKFSFYRLRAWAFRAISLLLRDPLNLHYLDSQSFLGHKPRLSDIRVVDLVEHDWRRKLERFPPERRLFIPLQLFPEASIDYWIDDAALIRHDELMMEVARAFTAAGFQIVVKDHPLQFGFRQVELLEQLKALPNVVVVPYDVSGNELLATTDATFTCTGTLGLQSALAGKRSIVTESYYTTPEDFIVLRSRDEVAELPRRLLDAPLPDALEDRQRRIVAHLLRGCFPCDFFSFKGFDSSAPNPAVAELGERLGEAIAALVTSPRARVASQESSR
jgi:hypothetical protein